MAHAFHLFLIFIFALSLPLYAQEAEVPGSVDFETNLTGNWRGLRSKAENAGISPSVVYRFLPIGNMRGGVETKTVWMDNLDITLTLDLEKLAGLKQTTFYVYSMNNQGQLLTPYVGDIQVVSNIETPTRFQPFYEVWLEKNFLDGRLSFLAGKYDLNLEFDVVNPGLLFIHSSFGIGVDYSVSGYGGPSVFPWTSWAGRAAWRVSDRVKIQAALLDASPNYSEIPKNEFGKDGYLAVGELWFFHSLAEHHVRSGTLSERKVAIDRSSGRASINLPQNRIVAGIWSYSSPFPDIETGELGGNFTNSGFYVSVQQYVFTDEDGSSVSAYVRGGFTNARFNRIGTSITGSILRETTFAKRPLAYGIGYAYARNGDEFQRAEHLNGVDLLRAETAVEISAAYPFFKGITFQPTLQYIVNPGTSPEIANAWIFGFQAAVEF